MWRPIFRGKHETFWTCLLSWVMRVPLLVQEAVQIVVISAALSQSSWVIIESSLLIFVSS